MSADAKPPLDPVAIELLAVLAIGTNEIGEARARTAIADRLDERGVASNPSRWVADAAARIRAIVRAEPHPLVDPNAAPVPQRQAIVWCYSDTENPDFWPNQADTREAAIEEGRAQYGGDATFWIASGYLQHPSAVFLDAAGILENAQDRAAEECEDGGEFVAVKPGGKEALDAFLDEWIARYVDVSYWIVDGEHERIEPLPKAPT